MQNNTKEQPWLESIKDEEFLIDVDNFDVITNIELISNEQKENNKNE